MVASRYCRGPKEPLEGLCIDHITHGNESYKTRHKLAYGIWRAKSKELPNLDWPAEV